MPNFNINEIIKATGGIATKVIATEFSDISTDSRKILPNSIFLALVGENFNGHNFIDLAIEKGATCIIANKKEYIDSQLNVTIITVDNTLEAYQKIACCYRRRFDIPVIAITGSNGKTTTKDLTASVLSSKYNVHKTNANFNNEIGLPFTLLQLHQEHDVAVVEMGMRGIGHIKDLMNIAEPNIGVVTNVGETHMELLGSIDNIAQAKGELVEDIPESGLVILNADDEHVKKMAHKTKAKVIFFGIDNDADVKAFNIKYFETNTLFDFSYGGKIYKCKLPLVGKHNVYNALAAIAVGLDMKLTVEEIQKGLDKLSLSAMRLAVMKIKGYTFINDAYNASPMSMKAAIESLNTIAAKRKIAVLGDMLELGSISAEAHRKIGDILADNNIDMVITLGEQAKNISDQARRSGISEVYEAKDHEEIKNILKLNLQTGDTVLLKGSRGMKMEKTLEGLF